MGWHMNRRAIFLMLILACSILANLTFIWVVSSTDHPPRADVVALVLALLTLPHNLTVLVLAFRQRRRLYTPDDMLDFVPVTAKAGVVWTAWILDFAWVILAIFYAVDLGAPRRGKWCYSSTVECLYMFVVSVVSSWDRLELKGREDGRQSWVA
ncbi:hypothetical protein D9611_009377 [Ephemerocybe angulata]|uniref:Uncharacterized protein n=1 Tax=Ephemerocybe angulata TaxID=980116 RepID=A0A8H5F4K9_9AGAR|nr:hypothetical protein D9611_009377 [Tulosesus angulatus]